MIEESAPTERARRVVEAMARYGHLTHALRIARLGSSSFWADLPLTLPQLKALGVIAAAGPAGRRLEAWPKSWASDPRPSLLSWTNSSSMATSAVTKTLSIDASCASAPPRRSAPCSNN